MTALQGYYNPGDGKSWRLAYSLQRLCAEVAVRWPDITNLGGKGDGSHALMGVASDHNALWRKPGDPLGIVRAVDFGGPYDQLMELRAHLYALGAAQFGPLWSFGYLKGPDSKGCAWPIGSGWNSNSGDEGHLHVSVTQTNGYNPVGGTAGYVPAIDSAESWGIADGSTLPGNALTPTVPEDDMFTDADRSQLANLYKALFEGGPSTPQGRSLVDVLANIDAVLIQGGTDVPQTVIDQLATIRGEVHNIYAGLYLGGVSTPGGKPLTQVLADILAKPGGILDPKAIAAYLAAELGDDLAADVAAQLTVTVKAGK